MQLIPLKSRLIASGDDLIEVIQSAVTSNEQPLKEGDILVIASKVVAYAQGLLEPIKTKKEFRELIEREADQVLETGEMVITFKNKILIPNAGIDNSNTPKGQVILWPKKPFDEARRIQSELKKEFKLKNLGILITDSHCQPLRQGTAGIAIGWAGFEGVQDERGKKDLFGKKMLYTQMATADCLASAVNLLMGETDASIPFVITRGLKVEWTNKKATADDYFISPKKCIYSNFYSNQFKKSV